MNGHPEVLPEIHEVDNDIQIAGLEDHLEVTKVSTFFRDKGPLTSITAGRDGRVYTGTNQSRVVVWQNGNPICSFRVGEKPVGALVVDDHSRVFSAHPNDIIEVYEVNPAEPLRYRRLKTLSLKECPRFLSGMRSNSQLNNLGVKDTAAVPVTCLCLSHDQRYLYAGYGDNILRVWEVETGTWHETVDGHRSSLAAVVASPNGQVFSGSQDGAIQHNLCTLQNQKIRLEFQGWLMIQGAPISIMHYSGGLYAGYTNGRILFWPEGRFHRMPEQMGHHTAAISGITGGSFLFTASLDGSVVCWRRNSAHLHEHLATISEGAGPVTCLEFLEEQADADDDFLLYVGTGDSHLRVWGMFSTNAGL